MPLKRLIGLVLVLGVIVCAASGCAVSDRQVISQAQQAHLDLQAAVITEPTLDRYINTVGNRLIASARQVHQEGLAPGGRQESADWMFSEAMRFHLVGSDTLNAFTTGGEHMYVYTGLFTAASSEAELAAVMAHEFAHVFARHVHKGMQRQQYTLLGAGLAGAAGYALADKEQRLEYALTAAGAATALAQFVGMGYTREDEREADRLGFTFYVRAGYPPEDFARFFQQMIDKGYDATPEMLSDHPSLASRVEQTDRWVAALPPNAGQWRQPPVAQSDTFKQLQASAKVQEKQIAASSAAHDAQLIASAMPNHLLPVQQPRQQQALEQLRALSNRPQR